jgi:3-methyladenine DNA glycosylase/8-oxoguanine DNA glycosylase
VFPRWSIFKAPFDDFRSDGEHPEGAGRMRMSPDMTIEDEISGSGRSGAPEWRAVAELPLVGPGGEPVDLWRTFVSHGVAELPPLRIDGQLRALEATLSTAPGAARTVLVAPIRPGFAAVAVRGRRPGRQTLDLLLARVRHVLALDENLSAFYAVAAGDPTLSWVTGGAGRMIRSATVFEEVVKTICTTNCTWSATVRMVNALVEHLGVPAPGAPADGPLGRAFPTPEAMASASPAFYRDVVRAGYRGRYLHGLAAGVAEGSIDVEELGRTSREELSDDEVERRLLALPGVGPYAAAHIMMLIGRYSRLILDSWTRPKYAKVLGRRTLVPDVAILRRFRRYGPYAGLAFWLVLTKDWVSDEAVGPEATPPFSQGTP